MKKVLLALLALGVSSVVFAAEVYDVKIKEKTLTGDKIVKESHKAWLVDDVLLMYIKGEVKAGGGGYDIADTGNEKETDKYFKGLVSVEAGAGVDEDGVYFLVEDSVLLGTFKITDDKFKASLKGVGVGEAGPDAAEAQFSISARSNQKLSDMDDADLLEYLAKKLKLKTAGEVADLADELGIML